MLGRVGGGTVAGHGLNCHRSPRGLQTGRCPFAASSAVSGPMSHNPPAPPATSASAVCSLTLGPWRSLEPTAACLCPGDLVDGKYKTGAEVLSLHCVEGGVESGLARGSITLPLNFFFFFQLCFLYGFLS